MIIDTHLHVWSDDVERYPFAEGRTQVGGGSVELLNQTMDEVGVDKAVIVQPIHYLFDNRYVAECLRRFPGRFAAIGLVDPKAPDAADRLEKFVREDGFGGLRIHSSRLDHPAEWAAPDQDPLWRRSEELGTCFIVHGPAANLPHLEPIIGRFPEVPVVLDHIGGAPTDEDPPFPLLSHVLDLARFPRVYVKFISAGAQVRVALSTRGYVSHLPPHLRRLWAAAADVGDQLPRRNERGGVRAGPGDVPRPRRFSHRRRQGVALPPHGFAGVELCRSGVVANGRTSCSKRSVRHKADSVAGHRGGHCASVQSGGY